MKNLTKILNLEKVLAPQINDNLKNFSDCKFNLKD